MNGASIDRSLTGIRICPIWIAPEWLMSEAPGAKLDANEWIDRCAASQIAGILLVTKQHDGRCIWATGLDSLTTADDDLRHFSAAARARGVKLFAYYSAGVDDHQAALHPSWSVVDKHGHQCRDIGYTWVCMNSPYRDFMIHQLAEVLESYPIDGLWLDIFSFGALGRECFCSWCQDRFAVDTGGDLLESAGQASDTRERWRAERLSETLRAVLDLRDQFQPGVLVTFNGAGGGPSKHPYLHEAALPLLAKVDYLSDEGHDPRYESGISKILRSFGKPFEVLTSGAIGNEWVGWVTKPPPLLCLEAAVVGSHGGHFGVGVSVPPDGGVPTGEMDLVREVATFRELRANVFEPQSPIADVSILVRPYARRPPEMRPDGAGSADKVARSHASIPDLQEKLPVGGVWDVLKEAHIAFDMVQQVPDATAGQALYLQGDTGLSAADCDLIRSFVADGGTLVAESHASLFTESGARRDNFALADVLGVGFGGYEDGCDGRYVVVSDEKLRRNLPDYPLFITGSAVSVNLCGAGVLAELIPPIGGDSTRDRHTASRVNPAAVRSSGPAITRHTFGRGTAIYAAGDIGGHLRRQRHIDPWAKVLLENIIRSGIDAPLFTTDAPSNCEVVVNTDERNVLFHILDYTVASEYSTLRASTTAAISLWLNTSRFSDVSEIYLEPGHIRLGGSAEPGWARVDIPGFSIHSTVVVRSTVHPWSEAA